MECPFVVGQRVVCVHKYDSASHTVTAKVGVALPRLHHVYTVRAVVMLAFTEGVFPALLLNELRNPTIHNVINDHIEEPAFFHGLFRPVVPRATDISVFRELLIETKPRVLV